MHRTFDCMILQFLVSLVFKCIFSIRAFYLLTFLFPFLSIQEVVFCFFDLNNKKGGKDKSYRNNNCLMTAFLYEVSK